MMAHASDDPLADISQAFVTLDAIEGMLETGTIGPNLRPWAVRVRNQLEESKKILSGADIEDVESALEEAASEVPGICLSIDSSKEW